MIYDMIQIRFCHLEDIVWGAVKASTTPKTVIRLAQLSTKLYLYSAHITSHDHRYRENHVVSR